LLAVELELLLLLAIAGKSAIRCTETWSDFSLVLADQTFAFT